MNLENFSLTIKMFDFMMFSGGIEERRAHCYTF